MKKIIAILLCGILLFSLCACGADEDKKDDEKKDDEIVSTKDDDENEKDEDDDDENEEASDEISRGKISGDKYKSSFLGFTFTKPSDWKFLSDDEIAQTLNVGQQVMNLDDIQAALAEQASIYDMAARNESTGDSVMVCFENTMLTAEKECTIDEVIDALKQGLNSVASINYDFEDTEEVTLGKSKFTKLASTATTQGVTMEQAYYVKVVGKYAISVIITSVSTDITDIEDMFSK